MKRPFRDMLLLFALGFFLGVFASMFAQKNFNAPPQVTMNAPRP